VDQYVVDLHNLKVGGPVSPGPYTIVVPMPLFPCYQAVEFVSGQLMMNDEALRLGR